MSFRRSLHKSNCELAAAIMCVVALCGLLARYVPPSFAGTAAGCTVGARSNPAHGQCFDHEDSAWGAPPSAALTAPFPVASPHLARSSELLGESVTDGWHYNRPPPIG